MKATRRRQAAELQVARFLTERFGHKVVRTDNGRKPHLTGKRRVLPWWVVVYYERGDPFRRLVEAERALAPPRVRVGSPRPAHFITVFHREPKADWRVMMRFWDWVEDTSWVPLGADRRADLNAAATTLLSRPLNDVVLCPGYVIDLHAEDWFQSMRSGRSDPTTAGDWPIKDTSR